MFKELLPILEKVNIHIDISTANSDIAVTIHPIAKKDGASFNVVPLMVSGTAAEIDEKLPDIISKHLAKVVGFVSNIDEFAKSLKTAEDAAKSSKSNTPKSTTTGGASATDKKAPAVFDPKKLNKADKAKYVDITKSISQAKGKADDEDMMSFLKKSAMKKVEELSELKDEVRAYVTREFAAIEESKGNNKNTEEATGLFSKPATDDTDEEEDNDDVVDDEADDAETLPEVEDTKPGKQPVTATADDDIF